MVNALLRMCLKESVQRAEITAITKVIFLILKDLGKKTVCTRHPCLWHGPGPSWICYSIVKGQCKTFKFWTVKWALHLPPDLCKGKQHSWMVNACLLQEAGEQNSHDVPGVFSTIQFLSLRHLLHFYFCCSSRDSRKGFCVGFFSPSADIDCSLTEISRGDFKRRPWLPSLCQFISSALTDIRLPALSVKCSSLEEYSKENKISNLLSAINFWEDWSHGTQCENSNLTLGWTLAEYQVRGGETTWNEVTCRIPEEFGAVE